MVITTKAISSSIVVAMVRLPAHKNRDRHAVTVPGAGTVLGVRWHKARLSAV